MNTIEVELVHFDGCPSWETAWVELGRAIAATRVRANLRLVNPEDLPPYRQHGFAGSPTIRIDSRDLEEYDGEPDWRAAGTSATRVAAGRALSRSAPHSLLPAEPPTRIE